ncbi:MAG TPA: hypothetical protein VMU53_11755 [Candidatus Sulfotelmatobacter sp.]|nr:hypothetical protein [Candidatus Sulfotelmatobacter sp.]
MKYVLRYGALAMTLLSGTAFVSRALRLFLAHEKYRRVAPSSVGSFDALFAGVACFGFGRCYQILGRSKSDATSRTQTEIELAYVGFLFAWFCFIFLLHQMSPAPRGVSSSVLAAFVFVAAWGVASGIQIRKKLFRQSTESLPIDLSKALKLWKGAHFISFSIAMSIAGFGVALKFLGANWLVPTIFCGASLGFLLLWRPRQMAANTP